MGTEYSHKCNKCNYTVTTSGPWEFYRDDKGKRKWYGHPGPASEEAEEAGIYGYAAFVYCPDCDKKFETVLYEYEKPYKKYSRKNKMLRSLKLFLYWPFPIFPKERQVDVKCSGCGNTKLVRPDKDNIRIVPCPYCREGNLMSKREWIS